ncbi:formate dehydrogenase accessory sulfurtransferase FdhD [Anaerobranca gottschalkii]|uniref:Sulfur carrier protein FdhD n=1 Tax=Anaerobranca gottschalkii DSM 13577 TaxID=1120990 RepID=A0A1I0BW36_9FIRM|nr:formate dehydrogenase accessory sulfurtransferase FdhD [Anaerobranca gottschalkii]SET11220.1 FdhD protein [Anaerobranca gottschalkii DSM 13577]
MSKKNLIITRYVNDVPSDVEDFVIEEIPLTIFLNGEQFITLLSTPRYQEELVVGFLLSEGLIKTKEDIEKMDLNIEQSHVYVELKNKNPLAQKLHGKRTITTGCGKGTIFYNVLDSMKIQKLSDKGAYHVAKITELMNKVQGKSELYRETGGVHFACLAGEEILYFREDIGRHNAVDKVLGRAFLDGVDIKDKILLTSGRLSSEIVLKVLKAGIPILVSRSAPSSLAVEIAKQRGLTLCGFVRGNKLNCYANPFRILS